MKNIYWILLLLLLLVSCKQKEELQEIRVIYYNYLFESIVSVKCDDLLLELSRQNEAKESINTDIDTCTYIDEDYIMSDTMVELELEEDYAKIIDTIITDKKSLSRIESLLKDLTLFPEKGYGVAARMKCYFVYNNRTDSLCINSIPILGMYNNDLISLNNELVYLIRESSGFYEWMGADIMPYFDELNDSTFIRKKVMSRFGEEY